MEPIGKDALLTFMYELGRFTQTTLSRDDFWQQVQNDELGTGIDFEKVRAAGPELIRFCASIVPALVVDFLALNPELVDTQRISTWAAKRGGGPIFRA